MTLAALVLVLIAAFTHATWNYAAKKSGGGLPFVWISSVFALALYVVAGLIYWLWRQPALPRRQLRHQRGEGTDHIPRLGGKGQSWS